MQALNAKRAAAGLGPLTITPTYQSLSTSRWLHLGAESAVTMALVLLVGLALVLGGRRWWSLLVALIPAAVVAGRFDDGYTLGQGWYFTTTHLVARMAIGTAVDTLAIATIMVLLVTAFPRKAAPAAAIPAALRGGLAAVILVGWWLIQNPVDGDGSRKVWLAQAIVWIIALSLIATSGLAIVPKVVVTPVIAPYLSVLMLDDLVGGYGIHFDGAQFTHHLLVAAGVVGWVLAAPMLHRHPAAMPATKPATSS